jgi:hypothetical protein
MCVGQHNTEIENITVLSGNQTHDLSDQAIEAYVSSRLQTQRLVSCDGRERQASDTDRPVCSVVAMVSGGIVACRRSPVRGGSPCDGDFDTATCRNMYLRVEAGRSSTTVSQFSFKNDGRKW